MSSNTLVINCDLRETRVALIEEGVIAELQIERAAHRGTVGNVILGRVSRVLPGMQAAFIDIGQERAAFLHVEDLIRPDDFEGYLAGDFGEIDKSESGKDAGRDKRKTTDSESDDEDDDEDESDDDEDDDEDESLVSARPATDDPPEGAQFFVSDSGEAEDDDEDDDFDEDESEDDEDSDDDGDESDDEDSDDDADDDEDDEAEDSADEDDSDDDDATDDESGETRRSEEEEEEDRGSAGGGRRRRRRRSGSGSGSGSGSSGSSSGGRSSSNSGSSGGQSKRRKQRSGRSGGGRSAEGGERGERKKSGRVSRDVPITEVVKEGDRVIVQVSKEPIGTKGARVTSHISLPGRYCVYLPTVDHVGISKRIGSAGERSRLRKVIEAMKPKSGGVIVRTVAAGLTKRGLKSDLGYLMRLWSEISRKVEATTAKHPTVLYAELDLVLKTARDLFTDDIARIVIDDREQYVRLVRFVETFLPHRVKDIELYEGDEPIFDAYGIEDEIRRALSRKVPLASGGYLVIDQAEALTAIDVNTGRFVGKGSSSLEETALKTNLEAVDEIAYQLRFRNVGGLVVLDLIDMEDRKNRDKVYRALDSALKKDKAKTTINRISELGLIEMTRKRTRESLSRTMHEPCFYCDGTGHIQSRTTIAYEILRQLRREKAQLPGYTIAINAHPAVIDLLAGEEKVSVKDAEGKLMRRIKLVPRKEYHIEQFDLRGE